ncbi:MAG: hypothetical protein ACLPRE_07570 [Limisphaerales bacterium]
MKRSGIILSLIAFSVIVAAIILVPVATALVRANRDSVLNSTGASLQVARVYLAQDGILTNWSPNVCHLFQFTNHYTISGTDYQCVVAADSWDYRARSNLLAITTNGVYLFIDSHGVTELRDWHKVPDY